MEPQDLALVLLAGPLAVGFLAGAGLRIIRRRRAPSVPAAIALLLASPVVVALIAPTIRLGIWDGALIGLVAGLGIVAGLFGWQDYPVEVLLGVASLALTLAAAEWVVRTAFPHPPNFPAIESAKLFLPPIDLENPEPARGDFAEFHRQAVDGCAMLYPERYPAYVGERTERSGDARSSIVYLGDSMTYGLGVGLERAFPAILEQRTPNLFHFNLGFPGTGTDYHYAIARHWIPLIERPVRLVVIGLYFNDILEIGQGISCCQNRSVLELESGSPVERCPQPDWVSGYGESVGWFLVHSPPPYVLRVAMEFSHMARYAGAVLNRNASQLRDSDRPRGEQAVWSYIGGILMALRDDLAARGIPLVAVMMPIRTALEAADPSSLKGYEEEQQLKELATSLGIRTLDPWDHFRALVKRNGSSRYFLGSDDIHFNEEGHLEMAKWLAENVPEIGAALRARSSDSATGS